MGKRDSSKDVNTKHMLTDEVYDGFDIFANDGKDQRRYKYFWKGMFAWPQADEYLLIVDRFNPRNVELRGPGFVNLGPLGPLTKKFIYIPKPLGDMVIDFKPKDDNDKKENFTFTPGIVSSFGDASQDEITIDYRVNLEWSDPVKYFYTPRVIENLQATIVGLIRKYVANHDKDSLIAGSSSLRIADLDPDGKLKKFESSCGLRVKELGINNVKLSEAVQNAKNEAAVARENVIKAQHEAEAMRAKAAASKEEFEEVLGFGDVRGFTNPQLVDLVGKYAALKAAQSEKATMIFGAGGNPSNNMYDYMLASSLYGRREPNQRVIDADDYKDVEDDDYKDVEDEERGNRRNRGRS